MMGGGFRSPKQNQAVFACENTHLIKYALDGASLQNCIVFYEWLLN